MHSHHFAHVIHPIRPKDLFLFDRMEEEKKAPCKRLKPRAKRIIWQNSNFFYHSVLIHYELRDDDAGEFDLWPLRRHYKCPPRNPSCRGSQRNVDVMDAKSAATSEEGNAQARARIQLFLHISISHTHRHTHENQHKATSYLDLVPLQPIMYRGSVQSQCVWLAEPVER